VLQQISSLCELGLMARTSAESLEAARYRCAVSEPLARLLAANAGVKLETLLPQGMLGER
jgi:Origin recognition complex (ORC) subunit 5 C-terminus